MCLHSEISRTIRNTATIQIDWLLFSKIEGEFLLNFYYVIFYCDDSKTKEKSTLSHKCSLSEVSRAKWTTIRKKKLHFYWTQVLPTL